MSDEKDFTASEEKQAAQQMKLDKIVAAAKPFLGEGLNNLFQTSVQNLAKMLSLTPKLAQIKVLLRHSFNPNYLNHLKELGLPEQLFPEDKRLTQELLNELLTKELGCFHQNGETVSFNRYLENYYQTLNIDMKFSVQENAGLAVAIQEQQHFVTDLDEILELQIQSQNRQTITSIAIGQFTEEDMSQSDVAAALRFIEVDGEKKNVLLIDSKKMSERSKASLLEQLARLVHELDHVVRLANTPEKMNQKQFSPKEQAMIDQGKIRYKEGIHEILRKLKQNEIDGLELKALETQLRQENAVAAYLKAYYSFMISEGSAEKVAYDFLRNQQIELGEFIRADNLKKWVDKGQANSAYCFGYIMVEAISQNEPNWAQLLYQSSYEQQDAELNFDQLSTQLIMASA